MRLRIPRGWGVRVALVGAVFAGCVALVSAPKPVYSSKEKAAYADPALVNFVRPGLVVKVLGAEIAQEGTIKAGVRVTEPAGLPLDKDGVTTPGRISNGNPGMIAAYIPKDQRQYVSYTTNTQRSAATGRSAIQAAADTGGNWQKIAEGEYVYTFGTRAPASIDRTATHAIGIYANRNLTEFELGINLDDDVLDFVPDGSPVTKVRDIIRTESCNDCHSRMAFHGTTGRISMPMCNLCHTPQTIDPDTNNTVDMPVMIHKIHSAQDYVVVGFANAVHDYSEVTFPTDLRNCSVCHEEDSPAVQKDAWLTQPTRAACGACHTDVNFATGAGHVNLPQISDNQCSNCHVPQGELEFDASIRGAHTVPQRSSMLSGLQFEILDVADGQAGKKPTVTFTVKDKNGNPIELSRMGRLALTLTGPTTDYTAFQNGYIQEDAIKAQGSGDRLFWTFNTAIPEGAKGTWAVGIEGRRVETILAGTQKQMSVQYGAPNAMKYFSVDGSPIQPRREVVSIQKCNECHVRLSLHGENRVDNVQYCVVCHNPKETDTSRRPAGQNPPESIDMATMIHKIHGGKELHEFFGSEFVVYGYGSRPHNYSEVTYPAPLSDCNMCHVNDSQSLPLPATNADVNNPRGLINPAPPATAACTSCHQSIAAASHALANTTRLGESCAACHGRNSEFSVNKVHASQ